jgi:hypothetical protein
MPVFRGDNGQPLDLTPADLRYGPKTQSGRIALGLTGSIDEARTGEVPYFLPQPDSTVCLRAIVVPSLEEGFRYFLNVPCLEGMQQGEVAP